MRIAMMLILVNIFSNCYGEIPSTDIGYCIDVFSPNGDSLIYDAHPDETSTAEFIVSEFGRLTTIATYLGNSDIHSPGEISFPLQCRSQEAQHYGDYLLQDGRFVRIFGTALFDENGTRLAPNLDSQTEVITLDIVDPFPVIANHQSIVISDTRGVAVAISRRLKLSNPIDWIHVEEGKSFVEEKNVCGKYKGFYLNFYVGDLSPIQIKPGESQTVSFEGINYLLTAHSGSVAVDIKCTDAYGLTAWSIWRLD